MVARNHIFLALISLQYVNLVAQAALGFLTVVGPLFGHAVFIHVVAEVNGGAFGPSDHNLLVQKVERRLATLGLSNGIAHVANQKNRVPDAAAVGRQFFFPTNTATTVVGARNVGILARLTLGQTARWKRKDCAQQEHYSSKTKNQGHKQRNGRGSEAPPRDTANTNLRPARGLSRYCYAKHDGAVRTQCLTSGQCFALKASRSAG